MIVIFYFYMKNRFQAKFKNNTINKEGLKYILFVNKIYQFVGSDTQLKSLVFIKKKKLRRYKQKGLAAWFKFPYATIPICTMYKLFIKTLALMV